MKQNQPTFYVLCGIPGSGKTTLGKYLSEKYNANLYSFDDLPDSNKPEKSLQNHTEIFQKILADLNSGVSVIYDSLHILREWRVMTLMRVSNIDCPKILYVMTTPLEECIKRNAQRIGQARLPNFVLEQSQEMYEPPNYQEGWNEIYMVNWR